MVYVQVFFWWVYINLSCDAIWLAVGVDKKCSVYLYSPIDWMGMWLEQKIPMQWLYTGYIHFICTVRGTATYSILPQTKADNGSQTGIQQVFPTTLFCWNKLSLLRSVVAMRHTLPEEAYNTVHLSCCLSNIVNHFIFALLFCHLIGCWINRNSFTVV